jgi:hypothetical protein
MLQLSFQRGMLAYLHVQLSNHLTSYLGCCKLGFR